MKTKMVEAEKRAVMGCWVLVLGGGSRRGREDGDGVKTVVCDMERKRGKGTMGWFSGGGKRTKERAKEYER